MAVGRLDCSTRLAVGRLARMNRAQDIPRDPRAAAVARRLVVAYDGSAHVWFEPCGARGSR
jgi:hypothetical protein